MDAENERRIGGAEKRLNTELNEIAIFVTK